MLIWMMNRLGLPSFPGAFQWLCKRCQALALGVLVLGAAPAVGQYAMSRPAELGWRGIVKALHHPTLTSELTTRISAIRFREGERFVRGDVLVEFDCRRQKHEVDALSAVVREARIAVEANRYLAQRGASNSNDVEIARARYDKAKAEHAAIEQRLAGCTILAPFDGIVTEVGVAAHEIPAPTRALMSIASIDDLEIELIVPSRALIDLKPGTRVGFAVDETGEQLPSVVQRRGGAVDSVSQTAKVYARFVMPPRTVLPGMSGTASPEAGGN